MAWADRDARQHEQSGDIVRAACRVLTDDLGVCGRYNYGDSESRQDTGARG